MQAIKLVIPSLLLALVAQSARLVDFQVAQPPLVPTDVQTCTVKLLE